MVIVCKWDADSWSRDRWELNFEILLITLNFWKYNFVIVAWCTTMLWKFLPAIRNIVPVPNLAPRHEGVDPKAVWTISSLSFFLLTPPMKIEQTGCTETSAYKIQTPRNRPKIEYNIHNTAEVWNREVRRSQVMKYSTNNFIRLL
jgi:hypothetical protein